MKYQYRFTDYNKYATEMWGIHSEDIVDERTEHYIFLSILL